KPGAPVGQLAEDLGAAHAREHEVEDDEVDVVSQRELEAGLPVGGRLDVVAGEGETAHHEISDAGLVFDEDEMGHGSHLRSVRYPANAGKESSHPSFTARHPLAVDLQIDLISGSPLRHQLEETLRDAVRSGRLAPGSLLPPSRVLAQELGVSRGVVLDSYSQLVAEGYLAAKRGSGTRVATLPAPWG